MLLHLAFENINSSLELLLVGACIATLFWFILRTYKSLGVRFFMLCLLLFAVCCTWLYNSEKKLQHYLATGQLYIATIDHKLQQASDNIVAFSFITNDKQTIYATSGQYVSDAEWNSFEPGKTMAILYIPDSNMAVVQQSMLRFKNDQIVLYFFAGFWLLLGVFLLVRLRRYKAGVNKHTYAGHVITYNSAFILEEIKWHHVVIS